jgi:hypothetical protein
MKRMKTMKDKRQVYDSCTPIDDFDSTENFLFKTIMKQRVINLPEVGGTRNFDIGLEITNNSLFPQKFLLFWAAPMFLQNGTKVAVEFGNCNGTRSPILEDFILLNPGQKVEFSQSAKLLWNEQGKSYVRISDGKGQYPYLYGPFVCGKYQVFMMYRNPYRVWGEEFQNCDFDILIDSVFKGKVVATPEFMEIRMSKEVSQKRKSS